MIYVREIGQGGLGTVALYRHHNGKHFAVKRMLHSWDGQLYERFVREIKIMRKLTHRNIIKVLGYDIEVNNPYYVMPFYQDGSLRDRLNSMKNKGKKLSPQAATSIVFVLAQALAYSHKNGAIHRDLKPENILFKEDQPILADWGLGKFIHKESKIITKGGIGTVHYCAPEQWHDCKSDERSDIYSLGLIFRELLTGELHGQITNAKIKKIIDRMTELNPDDRYQSMDEVMIDIKNLKVVNESNPMDSFWKGLAAAGLIIGIAAILKAIMDDAK